MFILLIFALYTPRALAGIYEKDRVAEYNARNYTWPPKPDEFRPNTPGWRAINERRFAQLEGAYTRDEKYGGYIDTVHSALMVENFTENGWGLTRAPQDIVDALVNNLMIGLQSDLPEEGGNHAIETERAPLFIYQEPLNRRILEELKPMHEAWANVKLTGQNAYGLRVYRNNSNLNMHVDLARTHVISSILHVGHDEESEPWPIVIEDFHGNTNEVFLESGDMLFYESSKLFHGRPRKFSGSFYCSVFMHYYPVDWNGEEVVSENNYRLPPHWDGVKQLKDGVEKLAFNGNTIKEPDCKDTWCALEDTVKWKGPAEAVGKVLSSGGVVTELQLDRQYEL